MVYVSHRMAEIFRLADQLAVLRDGSLVGVREAAAVTEDELVRMMVGRDLSAMFSRERAPGDETVLSVRGVSTGDVRDISLDVHAGEVVALAGLVGAGRSELAHAIVGDVPLRSGRKSQALLLERTVRDNVSLAVLDRLRRFRIVPRKAERELVEKQVARLRVRTPSIEQSVRTLSGGNQQKTVLARWLARRPRLLILDEPTRGVDVGAKAEIYAIIDELARDGMGALVISSELPEVLGLADRILAMRGGRLTGELSRTEASEERILALSLPSPAPDTVHKENDR